MVQTQGVRQLSYIQAVNEALRLEMERDSTVIIMGEDIAGGGERDDFQDAWGGPMRLTKGLVGQFGRERIRDTPIAESGFMGAGVGAAATGLRPVVDLMYVGFLGVCGDQILNNASKIHFMFGGKVNVPLTIMTGTGAGTNSAAQHSETVYSFDDMMVGDDISALIDENSRSHPIDFSSFAGREQTLSRESCFLTMDIGDRVFGPFHREDKGCFTRVCRV